MLHVFSIFKQAAIVIESKRITEILTHVPFGCLGFLL